jgi:hypothetical protein
VIATYAAVLAVCAASLLLGQAALALCGVRSWSWLAPAVGLALVCAICWGTVRIGENGVVPAVLVPVLTVAAAIHLWGRIEGGGGALRIGWPVGLVALLAASLPFAVEGHFGILGTGFNPDMSQHLLATDRLVHDHASQLLHQGYPLGPHSAVVALNKGLGIGIVQGFDGLTLAAATLAPLTALAAFADQPPWRRTAAALVVGLPYLVASYYAQGAFKELIQALLVLAFVLALRESARAWSHLTLRFVPAALLAIGSVYVYSFPGLLWLGAIAAIWATWEYVSPAGGVAGGDPHSGGRGAPEHMGEPAATGPAGRRALSLALIVFLVGSLPELGRMIDFHSFETFDPNGPGLGNLFGQISPFTALGVWPSGDFRLAPGDGAVPAFVYYLGAAFATALLLLGIRRAWHGAERAILAGLVSVAALYAAARLGGTPYTSAKALEIAAPICALAIVSSARRPLVCLYLLAAGVCSLLAFANAPVGPTSYSPALTSLRPFLASGSTLVIAPDKLLEDEQGARYVAWELRGDRVCIEPASSAGGKPPTGIRFVVTAGTPRHPPFERLTFRRRAGPYAVWERQGVVGGPSPCPLIAERQARAGAE